MMIPLWEVLVPASNNKRKEKFSYEHHKQWDEFVKNIAGGLSVFKTLKGEWIGADGTVYVDRMIPVRIRCTEEQIQEIVIFTIHHYSQEAVMFYLVSNDCRIFHKNDL